MAMVIGLVAASKRQRGGISRASEQYEPSIVFRRARDYCERTYSEWYILSAAHGLVPPQQVVGPDAPVLSARSAAERWAWADMVAGQLQARIQRSSQPVIFSLYAGQWYADLLGRAAPFATFELPLAGMSLGQRLAWFDKRLQVRSRVLTQPLPTLRDMPRS